MNTEKVAKEEVANEFVENNIEELKQIVPQHLVDMIHLSIILPLTALDDGMDAKETAKEIEHQIWVSIALGYALGKKQKEKSINSFFAKLFGKTK